jgi:hypothetical protein
MRTRLLLSFATLLCAEAARAQNGNFSVPALGYVHDKEGRSLRPILGVPGAATVGDPLPSDFPITLAAIAPRLDYVLARAENQSKLLLIRHPGGDVSWSEIDGVNADADQIVLDDSGRSAAVYSTGAGTVQVIAGLPDNPSVTRTIDAGGVRPGAMALSADGRLLAAAFGDVLRVIDLETGNWKDLGAAGTVTSLAFAPNGRDLAVAAANPAAVWLIRDAASTADRRPVLGEADGLPTPAGVRFAGDSRLLIAAGSAVTVVQLADNSRVDLKCACAPAVLEQLESSTFRLTDLSRGPLWILHESDEGSRLLFVPPPVSAEAVETRAQ